ncbi:MAG: hypothetical protein N2C12_10255 [Planctomycetales bacterium]
MRSDVEYRVWQFTIARLTSYQSLSLYGIHDGQLPPEERSP